jgi:UDP-N-acetylmuramate dehydrogenase
MEPRVIRGQVVKGVSMKRYTSMKVGGPVPYLFYPEDEEDVTTAMRWLRDRDIPFRFLGNGTNVVVADQGMSIGVIRITRIRHLRFTEKTGGAFVEAAAGLPLKTVIRECCDRGLSGLEKLYGIPGTVGGAIKMNAGSFAASVSDCLAAVRLADRNGTVHTLEKKEMEFGYRSSFVGAGQCILSATFEMKSADRSRIKADMDYVWRERLEKHPMDMPSAGSVFKNRNGNSTWKYIDQAGLRGREIGGARISEKHPNFIVNTGRATASDVKELIDMVKKGVREATGVALEEEVEMWGFNG